MSDFGVMAQGRSESFDARSRETQRTPTRGSSPGGPRPATLRVMPVLLVLLVLCLAAAPAQASASADPIDRSQPPAPTAPLCADWVHERYSVERGGNSWPTWHPPRDPRYHCAFGHEHGSNPRAFRYFRRAGMPAFGPIGAYAGSEEAHAGFKVFAANEDPRAWPG